jgi:glycosyltransferase involved in cell wall biosynthesis
MINRKKLIIFSYEYPFGHAEVFLHNEIQTLKHTFSDIIIVPSRKVWNRNLKYNHVRDLPPNVTVYQEDFSFRNFRLGLFFQVLILPFRYPLKFTLKNLLAILKQSFKITTLIGFLRHHNLIQSETIYYSYWKNESATAVAYLKHKKRINCAITRAHREDLYLEYGGLKPFDPFVSKTISRVYCISEDGRNYLLKRGFQKEKTQISRLGVYPTHMCNLYSQQGLTILSVSYLKPVKRVDLIAKAVLKLNMKVQWIHIGDGDEFDKINDIIGTNNKENISVELLGNKPNEFVYNYYRENRIDLFLNVSSSEGLPVSIMEAYSFGIPCMACEVGGNAEIIDREWKFLLTANLDENILANAISEFYGQRKRWPEFRENAYEIWKNNYNANDNFIQFAAELSEPCY